MPVHSGTSLKIVEYFSWPVPSLPRAMVYMRQERRERACIGRPCVSARAYARLGHKKRKGSVRGGRGEPARGEGAEEMKRKRERQREKDRRIRRLREKEARGREFGAAIRNAERVDRALLYARALYAAFVTLARMGGRALGRIRSESGGSASLSAAIAPLPASGVRRRI